MKGNTPLSREMLATTNARIKALFDAGIQTLADLLFFFPRDYQDLSAPTNPAELRADQNNLLLGTLGHISTSPTNRRGTYMHRAIFTEETANAQIPCTWFGDRAMAERLPTGRRVAAVGKAKLFRGVPTLPSPQILPAESASGGMRPIYSEKAGISSSWFLGKIQKLLQEFPALEDDFSAKMRKAIAKMEQGQTLDPLGKVLRMVHAPKSADELAAARAQLSFRELFMLHLRAQKERQAWEQSAAKGFKSIPLDAKLQKDFFASLPFTPTTAQRIAIFEILKDFEANVPARRLLEGDVGSGKTLVCAAAALAIIRAGGQVAMLCPTEVLARQHASSLAEMLNNFDPNLRVELLLGATPTPQRRQVLASLRGGAVHLLVGTHALLEPAVEFQNLHLVMVDEQHRFGVQQREQLVERGTPHVLHTTATPIPRSLAIVAYGGVSLSVLNEMPPGRTPPITRVVPPKDRQRLVYFLESEIQKSRQIFAVCPLIEKSEKEGMTDVAAVGEYAEKLKEWLPKARIAVLHGKMKTDEKASLMRQFSDKEIDVLVSTTVIEVGVDIPGATMMIIEGAERFGLSQLHQLRGRVGRRAGVHSYCFLCSTSGQATTRLRIMEEEHSGFRLAEHDLKLRGSGDLFGTRQSGLAASALSRVDFTNVAVLSSAKKCAEEYFEAEKQPGSQ